MELLKQVGMVILWRSFPGWKYWWLMSGMGYRLWVEAVGDGLTSSIHAKKTWGHSSELARNFLILFAMRNSRTRLHCELWNTLSFLNSPQFFIQDDIRKSHIRISSQHYDMPSHVTHHLYHITSCVNSKIIHRCLACYYRIRCVLYTYLSYWLMVASSISWYKPILIVQCWLLPSSLPYDNSSASQGKVQVNFSFSRLREY